MKKIIGLSLFAVLAMVSCKKNESAEQLKIDSTQVAAQQAPYLEVQVLLEEPEPALRHKIDEVLKYKNVKLARIQPHYPARKSSSSEKMSTELFLDELQPVDVFTKSYFAKYNTEVPEHLMQLFQQTLNEVNQTEVQ